MATRPGLIVVRLLGTHYPKVRGSVGADGYAVVFFRDVPSALMDKL